MKIRYSVLSTFIISALYSQDTQANLKHQCLLRVPHFAGEEITADQLNMPIEIEADRAVINQPKEANYSGNVTIKQGNRSIFADNVRIEQQAPQHRKAFLIGRYQYQDNLIQAEGHNALLDLQSKDAEVANTTYQLVGRQGRGEAESGQFTPQTRRLKNASFTACLLNDNAWSIEANEMVQHIKAGYAEMWHARFKIFDVPIFYSPYLQFPLGDQRRSGILTPKLYHSTKDGLIYSQPFYWNIAPNMDATFTSNYYSRRGWQINPEFRYLTALGQGILAGEYLANDRLDTYRPKDMNDRRYLFHWRHNMSFLTDWHLDVDYTNVSDRRYFSDFDSSYGNVTDGYALQHFKLGYYQPQYNLSISGKDFHTFDSFDNVKPYRVLPQIDFNYYQDQFLKDSRFSFFAQIARFENDSKSMPNAWRFHAEPIINIPFVNHYGSLNFETKLYASHYQQQKGENQTAEEVKKQLTRIIPQVKLDFQTVLEADKSLFSGFKQILEPRLQYVYRPYRDQSEIGSKSHESVGLGYDSALLQTDYYSLFNDRRYSGLDRISSANLITAGASTRFFNKKTGEEVFNISVGQTYYLRPSRVDSLAIDSTADRSSSWSVESNWRFQPKWNWHASYQYDTRLHKSSLANMSLQYKPSTENVFQLNYRYVNEDYINQNLSFNRYGQDIKQIGGMIGWNLTDKVAIMASHYRDIALKKAVETQLSLNYNTCCWSANLYVARQLTTTPIGAKDSIRNFYYDNKFGINFELRFGHDYSSGMHKMLSKGILPYVEQYGIN
ncbi:LPS assembly protein LptD [[Haemophilus] ducreyi]|uniref:LPS-assembly protein LptD n=2 Tax=Haemophilus ducreyi TaxID=730 RepID=LPTD_HAEDU|nr:LPS assembly protein LptD [[Haemophilus] ducreyi]Q7VKZ9.1 RecName: Full=LPS-assembly protein LptD; Flags: Precursor [[Haemophilus] ducreyi 35000HP]AAP96464.1 organic solvent tolerance protein [[Haemophilus] ducreyi 35000HP]AKO31330.1 LPS biosynthesis protein [[Haemophilus] ducreyi]AKO32779.1 LPS biosynthesis protein [[Haemophilus] ducreyi]AKO34229.1 LPS biosynthesis protein [[Haemophilus] ducreyi]AKO35672.1 LPS biosynthesis protein [[Haemophilus] ducreyi]